MGQALQMGAESGTSCTGFRSVVLVSEKIRKRFEKTSRGRLLRRDWGGSTGGTNRMTLSKNPGPTVPALVPVLVSAFVLAAAILAAAAPVRAEADFVQAYEDWTLQTNGQGEKRICLLWSLPQKAQGKYKKRGNIYAYVTHRPANDSFNEISILAGYTYRKESTVSVGIGKRKFKMFTDGNTAWNHTSKEDAQMVRAMRAGNTMVVRGVSSRGTKTTDTYSLRGFTKAYQALAKACPKKKKSRPAKKSSKKK